MNRITRVLTLLGGLLLVGIVGFDASPSGAGARPATRAPALAGPPDEGAMRAMLRGVPMQGTATPTASPTPAPCGPAWRVVASPSIGPFQNVLYSVAWASTNDVWA